MAADMTGKLAGKVALVTGGDGGLGSAMCLKFAAAGASVAVGWYGKDPAHADALVKQITDGGGKAIAVSGQRRQRRRRAAGHSEVIDGLGGIHIVVNNAGFENDHAFLEMPAGRLAVRHQCQPDRAVSGRPDGGEVDGRQQHRRRHHQHFQRPRHHSLVAFRPLLRRQSGPVHADQVHGGRAGRKQNPGRHGLPRRDCDPDQQERLGQSTTARSCWKPKSPGAASASPKMSPTSSRSWPRAKPSTSTARRSMWTARWSSTPISSTGRYKLPCTRSPGL